MSGSCSDVNFDDWFLFVCFLKKSLQRNEYKLNANEGWVGVTQRSDILAFKYV